MVPEKMMASRFYAPGVMKFEEVPVPKITAGELLVKIETTLTCGTDVKLYRRGHPLVTSLPMIIGHEFSGIVAAVGDNVEGFKEGMRVVAANSAPCNACYYCKRGQPNLCGDVNRNLIGFSTQGAYAEYIRVPASIVKQNTHILPAGASFEEAALTEPSACVVHGNELANIQLGDSVAVIGAGPIGLLHVQLAKLNGAKDVVIVDMVKGRLNLALDLGATHAVDASQGDEVEKVKELTSQRGVDVAIEAVGSSPTWQKAVEMTRKGGTAVLFGGCPSGTTVSFNADKIHYQELTLKGVFHHTPAAVERVFNLITSGAIRIKPIITHHMPLRDVDKALELMATGACIKAAITAPR
ncbi:MAG: zinc-binding dehydrogenase [Candidatus Bathyarchaeia archaeon]